jgi:hypothetical protein
VAFSGTSDQGSDKRPCKSSALTMCGSYEPADDKFTLTVCCVEIAFGQQADMMDQCLTASATWSEGNLAFAFFTRVVIVVIPVQNLFLLESSRS